MKGSISIHTVIMLVLGVIVLGVAIYFLTFVTNFDSLFLSNNQNTLAKYSTCALALCAYGYMSSGDASPEVNQVECLKREGGDCVLTCSQVKEKIFDVNGVGKELRGSNQVYCGEESKIEFEFSDLEFRNAVPLVSGQMDGISKPNWLCKPIKIGNIQLDDILGNVPFVNTADALYHGTDSCIMLAKLSEVPVTTIANLFQPDNERIAGGCFTGITFNTKVGIEQLYTPILEYNIEDQKVHPSGIYLDASDHFTDTTFFNKPECEFENSQQQEFIVTDQEISDLAKKYENTEFEQIVSGSCENDGSECDYVKVPFNTLTPKEQAKIARSILKEEYEDITFVDDLNECPEGKSVKCQQFGQTEIPDNSLGDRISKCNFQIRHNGDKILYSVYAEDTLPTPFALFGSCKTVTLDRKLSRPVIGTPIDTSVDLVLVKEIQMVFEPKIGESTQFSGKVEFEPSESIRKEIEFNLFIDTVFNPIVVNDFPKETSLDKNGEFEFEYEFPFIGEDRTDVYTLEIEYDDQIIKEIEFELTS